MIAQACGCIFAEILGRKPVFKGVSTKDQLEVIVAKLGAPPPSAIRGITHRSVIEVLQRGVRKESVPWAGGVSLMYPSSLDLYRAAH